MSSNCGQINLLKDDSGEIAELLRMGIPESAILRYIAQAHEDKSKGKALKALLADRSLTSEQVEFVKSVLNQIPL